MDLLNYQLHNLSRLATTPIGLIGLVMVLLMPIAVLIFPRFRWVVLTLALYVSGLSRPHSFPTYPPLVPVLAPLEAASRPIITFLLAVLLLPTLWPGVTSWRRRLLLGGSFVFFIFEAMTSIRDIFGGSPDRGILTLLDFVLVLIVMGLGISRWLQSVSDVDAALKCLFAMGVLFVLGTIAQISTGGGYLLGNRLNATTDNPNAAGLVIVSALPATLYLLVRKGQSLAMRVAAAVTAGLLTTMLLWSGSRCSLLIAALTYFAMFRRRFGALAMTGAILTILAIIGLNFFGSDIAIVGRIITVTDTRSAGWLSLLHGFMASPVYGVGFEAGGSENSYLLTASHAGLLALVPLLVSLAMIVRVIFQLRSKRKLLGGDTLIFDLASGAILAMLAGAMFEGFLMANFSAILMTFFIYLAIISFVRDALDRFAQDPQTSTLDSQHEHLGEDQMALPAADLY